MKHYSFKIQYLVLVCIFCSYGNVPLKNSLAVGDSMLRERIVRKVDSIQRESVEGYSNVHWIFVIPKGWHWNPKSYGAYCLPNTSK